MLSNFFRSARSLLNQTPEPELSTRLPAVATTNDEAMVTTRKQAGSQDVNSEESPKTASKRLTRSAAKGGIEELMETEPLPVRVKDDGNTSTRSKVEVVIPVSRLSEAVLDSNTDGPTIHEVVEIADSEESEVEDEGATVNSLEASKASKDDYHLENPSEESNEVNKETEASKGETIVSNKVTEGKAQAGKVSKKSIPGTPVTSSPATLARPTPTPRKSTKSKAMLLKEAASSAPVLTPELSSHKRFGSEDPEVESFPTEPIPIDMEEASSEDDSDDAPEEFNKKSGAKVHEEQDRDASKAIEMQEAAIREKRKEREARLRQQAEVANKKRKRREEAVTNQPSSPKKAKVANSDEEMDIDEDTAVPWPQKVKFSRESDLPEFLPAEFLNDDDASETSPTESTLQPMIPRKTKQISLEEKKPKDRRKGSTIYRVSEATDMRLAPKASRRARSEKAQKMHGGNRKPFSKSFFNTESKR